MTVEESVKRLEKAKHEGAIARLFLAHGYAGLCRWPTERDPGRDETLSFSFPRRLEVLRPGDG